MEDLILLLFERMGMLLVLTFILTRFSFFRQLFDKEMSILRAIYSSVFFGLFGVLGTYAGIVVRDDFTLESSLWLFPLHHYEAVAHSALVGVVIGGLIGRISVGLGAGIITGLHLYYIGGYAGLGSAVAAPIIGILTGLIAKLFIQNRVVPTPIAFFCGVFAPVVLMGTILILVPQTDSGAAIQLVNTIGLPMMLTNSISIAIFMTMLQVAMREEDRTAAHEAERALHIVELALPHLKLGLTSKTAEATAKLLAREMKAAAVVLTDTERMLAYVGAGASSRMLEQTAFIELSNKAFETGEVQIAYSLDKEWAEVFVKLDAAILVPFQQGGKAAGLIAIFYKRNHEIRKVEIELAKGLSKLFTYQLGVAAHEKMASLLQEAELRMLQAQINPHFLFNTLNAIHSLIRVNPDLARHVMIQLSTYMRLSLKITSSQLIPIQQEMKHLSTYLELIKIRFADQFSVLLDMDPRVEAALIPPATFQPLVENSIMHGLNKQGSGGWIRIRLWLTGDRIEVCVEDNGAGFPEEHLHVLGDKPVTSKEGNGIGVYNVNQRLIHLFGAEARIQIRNRPEGGSRISFTIPCGTDGLDANEAV
ncbi:LytS/YhcK type 5TM receptor domain-containing protein [Paenibacillus hexagrammi]|uniref:Histidine kinase n=1 Tax=Paenibacillus hexagrammi TaxID=2908839 RepID=A0ABY3SJR6_9BACL|nr:LytS/YhcK type 5TM receptor domain-containing protein [Paenibacillus sp. YPD9-1]UJF33949.1 histidine kinase [Paenibacillus sp. YPD9-1]